MRSLKTIVICLAIAVVLAPACLYADPPCQINDLGTERTDTDCDGIIDYTDEGDADFDTIPDGEPVDNCIEVKNGNCGVDPFNCDADDNGVVTEIEMEAGYQRDWNDDGEGDVCDDTDYDGIPDYLDHCKTVPDVDNDPTVCADSDHDGFEDLIDNCPERYNPTQHDSDNDGYGDWCDNCRLVYNPSQADADDDGRGDLCDSGGYVTPDVNDPNQQETNPYDREYYDFGPDRLEGNGFGKGGCSIGGASADAGLGLMAMLLAAIAAVRRRS